MNDQPNGANLFQFTAYEKEDIALFEWVTRYTGYKVHSYSRYGKFFYLFMDQKISENRSIFLGFVIKQVFLESQWKDKDESHYFFIFVVNDLQRYLLFILKFSFDFV